MTRGLILSAALSAALFVALGILSKGWLEPAGSPIFDARLTGYDMAAATAYLDGLTPQARGLYLGLFRVLDTMLPLVLFLTLAGMLWRYTPEFWPPLRGVMLLLPALYLAADLLENAQVARLLSTDGGIDAGQVRMASTYTQMKWLSLGICQILIVGTWAMARRKRGRTT